ncbi:HlyU family transcriptional regulator [Bartonella sp. LJL80]
MSFLKKLFGKNGSDTTENAKIPGAKIEYQGFVIEATPYKSEGQLQSCGMITKDISGEIKEHRFVRADRFSQMEDAVRMIHIKARQIIDEQGENIFR